MDNGSFSDKDTLFMLSGVALIVFGAGLILSNPIAKRYLGQFGLGDLAQGALPDLGPLSKIAIHVMCYTTILRRVTLRVI